MAQTGVSATIPGPALCESNLESRRHRRSPVRVIDVFVDTLDVAEMSFEGMAPETTGRPSYHPSVLLKLDI
jgi:transposase